MIAFCACRVGNLRSILIQSAFPIRVVPRVIYAKIRPAPTFVRGGLFVCISPERFSRRGDEGDSRTNTTEGVEQHDNEQPERHSEKEQYNRRSTAAIILELLRGARTCHYPLCPARAGK